jgi:predicted nucleic acid-binding protein
MSVKIFLDTNIIIYSYSLDEPEKKQKAIQCLQSGQPWISTQVLNETVNILKRKFSLDFTQINAVIDELTQQLQIAIVTVKTIQSAIAISEKYQFSYFDSLIVASALEVGCDFLYTEDLHDGQEIDHKLIIFNPLLK